MHLFPISTDLQSLLSDTEKFAELTGCQASQQQLDYLAEPIQQSLDFYSKIGAKSPWIGYLVASDEDHVLRGICGFKGNPDPQGTVEISYHTLGEFENQGFGTRTAGALVELARDHHARSVVAHTLPEQNASGRLLEKNGFEFLGACEDPEDGTVWRWQLNL